MTPSPDTSNAQTNFLESVSCVSSTFCIAVGDYYNDEGGAYRTLIETWDGSSWTITPSPNGAVYSPDGFYPNFLQGVSCTSPTFCVAVGWTLFQGNGNQSQALIETWDGSSWTITPSPVVSDVDRLVSVSCTSTTFCLAAGSVLQALSETWDGSSWTVVSSPNFGADNVSCVSMTFCMAVGPPPQVGVPAMAEVWDGTSWTATPMPNEGSSDYLNGVSCTSTTSCVATGGWVNGPTPESLFETWDGTTWTITPSPEVPYGEGAYLFGVSCTEPSWCVSVGYLDDQQVFTTLVYAGTQATGPAPNASTGSASALSTDGATLNGSVTPNGETTYYFEYGKTTSYGSITPVGEIGGSTSDPVSSDITGLSPGITYHFQLVAANATGTAYGGVTTFTTSFAPAITSANHVTFTKGLAGHFTVTAGGSPAPIIGETGALPLGVTLSPAGVLSGTTTVSGTFPITITASNGVAPDATQSFVLTVGQTGFYITTASVSPARATIGSPYQSNPLHATGATTPYKWKVTGGALPKGLKLKKSTGVIFGTVKQKKMHSSPPGVYTFTVTATDHTKRVHKTAQATFTITLGS